MNDEKLGFHGEQTLQWGGVEWEKKRGASRTPFCWPERPKKKGNGRRKKEKKKKTKTKTTTTSLSTAVSNYSSSLVCVVLRHVEARGREEAEAASSSSRMEKREREEEEEESSVSSSLSISPPTTRETERERSMDNDLLLEDERWPTKTHRTLLPCWTKRGPGSKGESRRQRGGTRSCSFALFSLSLLQLTFFVLLFSSD